VTAPDGPLRVAWAIRLLPKRLLSAFVGWATGLKAPGFLLRFAIRRYAKAFGADPADAAEPFEVHRTFRAFFTRPLKPGARPLPGDPAAIASPCDGRVVLACPIEQGTVLQAKDVPYALADLLGDEHASSVPGGTGGTRASPRFDGGTALTLYLAPGDYHRFHAPFDGEITEARHLPGDLWPVNAKAVAGVPRLFARNERVVLLGTTRSGQAFAFVPVGALNVGSIVVHALPGLVTNRWGRRAGAFTARFPHAIARGEELGWFAMGSSIVLLLGPGPGHLDPRAPGSPLRMGERIGAIG
jgi:phosphatidylserine decarboxylase